MFVQMEGKAQRKPNTAAHSVMKEITRKIKDGNAKEKGEVVCKLTLGLKYHNGDEGLV